MVVCTSDEEAKKSWCTFMGSLRLNKRLEFNQGDIGVAGGIQMREAANINPTTIDMIRRFGGSTSPEIQWPEDDVDGEGDPVALAEKRASTFTKRKILLTSTPSVGVSV